VGLDPDISRLPQCVKSTLNPIWEFNRAIIDATAEYACAFKPNLAFYLADGVRGWEALFRTVEHIPTEIPVILDCKVGDIGSTMEGYAKAFFTTLGVDAITVNPLMGADVLHPILKLDNSFAFVLALTSNPSAQDFFLDKGMSDAVPRWLESFPKDRCGAVVGATQTTDLLRMRDAMPDRLFLIPGIGTQGGDLEAVLRHAIASKEHPDILINSSRGIIYADSGPDFAKAAAREAKTLRDAIAGLL
jgi:orotidine-5'-phosphate decarboxylase